MRYKSTNGNNLKRYLKYKAPCDVEMMVEVNIIIAVNKVPEIKI
jgi:hypothetical protein